MIKHKCNFEGGNRVELKCDEKTGERIHITIEGEGNVVVIEEMVEVADCLTIHIVDNNNVVHIGRGTTFEETSISVADCDNHVVLGEDCMFARNTRIMASDFHAIIDLQTGQRTNMSKEVIVDNHVWVGYGAVILKNTHIFSNSIIGAGTIVHGKVSANSIYTADTKGSERAERRLPENSREVTWERQRQMTREPLKVYHVEKSEQFDAVRINNDIVVNVENNISTCFNRIKGWVIWKEKDSGKSELYIRCLFRKDGKEANWVVPLISQARTDVAEYFNNQKYVFSGFDSYMPADVIHNWQHIERVELIIRNNSMCGKKILFDRM